MAETNNESRTLHTTNGLTFDLKYITNEKNLSWYNKQEQPQKQCDYCAMISSEKKSIHSLVKTGISIFEGHELLVSNNHAGDFIGIHLKHMLNIVDENSKAAIAFDGTKNASIKKYHFSCHFIANKNQLPITEDINQKIYKEVITQDNLSVGRLDVNGRNPICIKSTSTDVIIDTFHELEKHIGVNYSTNNHPYINLIIWKENDTYILAAIPRVVYKPTEYYDENNKWDIAPGAMEMSGLFLIANHSEYLNVKPELLLQISEEISFGNSHILEILNAL